MAPLSICFNRVLTVTVHVEQGNYAGVNENHADMERQAKILIKLAYFACSAILGENNSKLEVKILVGSACSSSLCSMLHSIISASTFMEHQKYDVGDLL